jgi:thiol-disulfide isomerase/thioredoxin
MKIHGGRTIFAIVIAGALLTASAVFAFAGTSASYITADDSPVGIWIGAAQLGSYAIPFRLEITGTGNRVQGALVNGKERYGSSSGSYSNGHLLLNFDYYANILDATLRDGVLIGAFSGRGRDVPINAQLNGKLPLADANPPHIGGVWEVAVNNGAKGEHTWKLQVRQVGPHVDAVVERIDGDTGNLYGVWRDGEFVVSHFTAGGPSFAVLRPHPDGTLQLLTSAHGDAIQSFSARRTSPVRAVALESVDDPLQHTSLRNPSEPLAFRFPDLSGKLVSNTDPEFVHKPLIVSIGGSWCPNCQDEAPFLEELYRKYHSRGLEIVELSFEESSQLKDPVRLKAVIRRSGITFPVLVAGTPDQLNDKFPQVVNLNCWPTTFLVGKDGLVKAIHTGYAGPATGVDNHELEHEMTTKVERLLSVHESLAHP